MNEESNEESFDSDDECEINYSDFKYLISGEKQGYLLKRSSGDLQVWRRRLCILTDKLWFAELRGERVVGGYVCFDGISVSDIKKQKGQPYEICICGIEKSYYFRAGSSSEQLKWVNELQSRASFSISNSIIAMADTITCDEESSRVTRTQRKLENLIKCRRSAAFFKTFCTMKYLNEDSVHYGLYRSLFHSPANDITHYINKYHKSFHIFASLVVRVQEYKELFRHELGVSPTLRWFAALSIYLTYIRTNLKCSKFVDLIVEESLYVQEHGQDSSGNGKLVNMLEEHAMGSDDDEIEFIDININDGNGYLPRTRRCKDAIEVVIRSLLTGIYRPSEQEDVSLNAAILPTLKNKTVGHEVIKNRKEEYEDWKIGSGSSGDGEVSSWTAFSFSGFFSLQPSSSTSAESNIASKRVNQYKVDGANQLVNSSRDRVTVTCRQLAHDFYVPNELRKYRRRERMLAAPKSNIFDDIMREFLMEYEESAG